MFSMFKVISIRSGEIRTVYAVDHCARFLIYRDGEWIWEESRWYEPVDAAQVVHGRWVLVKPRRTGRNATYKCTACGQLRSSYYNDVTQWKHCPCGARMDGDGNA